MVSSFVRLAVSPRLFRVSLGGRIYTSFNRRLVFSATQPCLAHGKFMTTSTTAPANNDKKKEDENKIISNQSNNEETEEILIYKGPFAPMTFRLKAISITTAVAGAIGVPLLLLLYSGDMNNVGQYAVGGTAVLGACGSTVVLDFVFSPYIHTLHQIKNNNDDDNEEQESLSKEGKKEESTRLLKATTRNLFAMKRETIFDPATDVQPYSGFRPFCNFMAKNVPLFVHREILTDETLRAQLLGNDDDKNVSNKTTRKSDEDELF